jgi:hypothetical protein
MFRAACVLGVFAALITSASPAWGYGPFNHLCVVDRNWEAVYKQIRAVGQLNEVEAMDAVFAGAIADDLGYYYFLNPDLKHLTNQTHYIRTGEWVDFLLRSARSPQNSNSALDYAFALGVLSHYAIDRMGHYYGTNAVAVSLAHQQMLFGLRMTYERDPGVHTKVEAGFDVVSLSQTCPADKLSDRFYAFLREPGWPDGEQVFGFVVRALRQFYGDSAGLKASDLVQALIVSRLYIGRLMRKEGSPYASRHIASNIFDTPALKAGGHYAKQTPEQIAEEEEWIDHQIGLAMGFKDQAKNTDYPSIFENSFERAQNLLLGLLQSAEGLRGRQDDEIKRGLKIEMDGETFKNINLDANQLSMSGRYDLADCTAEHLLANSNRRVSYPATTGGLAQYFSDGELARATMNSPPASDGAALQKQLKKIADVLSEEHQATENALALEASWKTVKFIHQDFPATGGCPEKPGAIPFGTGKNICVGPTVVYWQGKVRALSLLFAASAASGLTSAQSPSAQKAAMRRELGERKEAVESYRLCDQDKNEGYLGVGLCKDGTPNLKAVLPAEACVNRD